MYKQRERRERERERDRKREISYHQTLARVHFGTTCLLVGVKVKMLSQSVTISVLSESSESEEITMISDSPQVDIIKDTRGSYRGFSICTHERCNKSPVHNLVHSPVHSPVHGPVQSPQSTFYTYPSSFTSQASVHTPVSTVRVQLLRQSIP